MFLVFEGAFGVLRVEGALVHVWNIGWYLEAWRFGDWSIVGTM